MAKTLKSAAQLTALINAELSKHTACTDTGAEGIEPVADIRIPHNWTCKFLRGGSQPSADCQEVLAMVVRALQQKYDLAPED
jgi:hypothetical protein